MVSLSDVLCACEFSREALGLGKASSGPSTNRKPTTCGTDNDGPSRDYTRTEASSSSVECLSETAFSLAPLSLFRLHLSSLSSSSSCLPSPTAISVVEAYLRLISRMSVPSKVMRPFLGGGDPCAVSAPFLGSSCAKRSFPSALTALDKSCPNGSIERL